MEIVLDSLMKEWKIAVLNHRYFHYLEIFHRESRPEVFHDEDILENFEEVTENHLQFFPVNLETAVM